MSMEKIESVYKFVTDATDCGALQFGDFTLKSGRKSPFFFNVAKFSSGKYIRLLADYYARTIANNFNLSEIDVLFGPAYKGIALAATVAERLYADYYCGGEVRFCSNRKEAKDHGDMGPLVGAEIHDGDRILMIEDVTTTGKSMDETIPLLKRIANVEIVGLVVALDRGERGCRPDRTAQEELAERYEEELRMMERMPEALADAMGNQVFLAVFDTQKELDAFYRDALDCV